MAIEPAALTEAMMQALGQEWQTAKGAPLPDAGIEDRRILFAAVARGVLTYLKAHEDEVLRSIDLQIADGSTLSHQVVALDLAVEGV